MIVVIAILAGFAASMSFAWQPQVLHSRRRDPSR